jgi:predicted nucleotide-binding protein
MERTKGSNAAFFEAGLQGGRLMSAQIASLPDDLMCTLESNLKNALATLGVAADTADIEAARKRVHRVTNDVGAKWFDVGIDIMLLHSFFVTYSVKPDAIVDTLVAFRPLAQQLRVGLAYLSVPDQAYSFVESICAATTDPDSIGKMAGGLVTQSEVVVAMLQSFSRSQANQDLCLTHGAKVFIVHGRNEAKLHSVARLLTDLKLQPLVLREQPNRGRSIMEKFVEYSDVSFAVVLLTPDDAGGLLGDDPHTFRPRARQNVLLELGFFLGKLGRERVCVLCEGDIEVPSDYQGVLFVPLDDKGAWRLELARELRTVGLAIDMNAL